METQEASKPPIVTVIIPTFNVAEYIGDALESLRTQTFRDFEVVIIDDCSTDNTVAIAESFSDAFPLSIIKSEKNVGAATARNIGLAASSGEWVTLLDADDTWMPEKLERQIELVRNHQDISIVFTNGYQFDESGDLRLFYRKPENMPSGDVFPIMLRRNCFYASSVMIRRTNLDAAGGFTDGLRFAADLDLWIRLFERGAIARGLWEPLTRYRERQTGNSKNSIGIYETTIHICKGAMERISDPALRRILKKCMTKAESDLHMDRAKMMLRQGGETADIRREIYLSWRMRPKRIKRLLWIAKLFLRKTAQP